MAPTLPPPPEETPSKTLPTITKPHTKIDPTIVPTEKGNYCKLIYLFMYAGWSTQA